MTAGNVFIRVNNGLSIHLKFALWLFWFEISYESLYLYADHLLVQSSVVWKNIMAGL